MPTLAIVGAGNMGANHVRTARGIRGWEEVLVVDRDIDRAEKVAAASGFRAVKSLAEVVDHIDAAVVAVPSDAHEPVMDQLFDRGIHTLLEKPVATELAVAERICRRGAQSSARVLVGHVERFNAAVAELMLHAHDVRHIESFRVGAAGGRPGLGDVVADLMVHDLDIVRAIAETRDGSAEFDEISAMWGADSEDICTAMLRSRTGLTATLVASRAGQFKDRRIVMTGMTSQVSADLVRQSVTIHRLERTEFVTDGRPVFRQRGTTEIPFLDTAEPLQRELQHLLAITSGSEQPLIGLSEGTEAMRLVQRVREAAGDCTRPAVNANELTAASA